MKEAYEKKMIMEYDDSHASLAQYNNRNGFQTEGLPGERLPACEGFETTMVQPTQLQVQSFANNGTSQCPERWNSFDAAYEDYFNDLDLDNLVQNSPPGAATVQPNINNGVRCKFMVVFYLLTIRRKLLKRRESRFGDSLTPSAMAPARLPQFQCDYSGAFVSMM